MKKMRYFLYGFLFLVVVVLAVFYVVPTGHITYNQDLSKKYFNLLGGRGFFYKLGPAERLFDNNKIIGDPVYFNFRTSRNFSKVKMTLKYKISAEDLLPNRYIDIKAGVLMDKANWRYSLYPVFNNKLNNILKEWPSVKEGKTILIQKNNKYPYLKDFFNSNNFSSSLFYNYDFDYNYTLPDYKPDRDKTINISNLRGSYSFYTYIKDESLKINFSFLDKKNNNRQLSVFVYYKNKLISQNEVSTGNFELNLPDLPEGAYKVEIKADDDWITEKLISNNSKIVFIDKIWLDNLIDGFVVWSNQNNFKIKSFSTACLSDINVNKKSFSINEIYKQFNVSVDNSISNGLNELSSRSCGLLIETDGLFSFSENSFFDPTINEITEKTDWNNIDTIVADYNIPIKDGDYYISEMEMNLQSAVRDKDGYRFVISAPFLKNLDNNEYMELKEITMDFEGSNLIDKVKSIINKR